MGSGSRATERTEEITIDSAEIVSVNQAAEFMRDQIQQFHRKHDVPMPVSPERLKMDLQLLTLNRQNEYQAVFVDDGRRIRYQLRVRLHYK